MTRDYLGLGPCVGPSSFPAPLALKEEDPAEKRGPGQRWTLSLGRCPAQMHGQVSHRVEDAAGPCHIWAPDV